MNGQTRPEKNHLNKSAGGQPSDGTAPAEAARRAAIVEAALDGVITMDHEGKVVDFNPAAERIFGYRQADAVGRPLADLLIPPGLRLAHRQGLARYLATGRGTVLGKRLEMSALRADGTELPVELSIACVRAEGSPLFIGFVRDLTEQRRTEQALRASEAKYRAIFDNAVEGFFQTSPEGAFLSLNPALARIYGYESPEEVIAHIQEVAHQLYVDPNCRQQFIRLMEARGTVKGFEFQIRRKDGSRAWVSESSRAVRDADGTLLYYEGTVEDITERKQAEDALRGSEERFRTLIENNAEVISLLDAQARVHYVSPAITAVLGYTVEEHVGQNAFDLLHPEDHGANAALFAQLLKAPGSVVRSQFRFRHKDGSWRWLEASGSNHLGDATLQAIVVNFRDITERKRAEEERRHLEAQILHAQKLESLGVLAGGIAHDFNNLLTAVLGHASFALMQLPAESVACPMLREIEKAAQRAAELTQQMLAYAGKGRFVVQSLRLDTLVQEMTKLLQTVVSKKAAVELHLGPATIEGDATQIRQVVMNLMTNASEALEGNLGTIRVRTGIRQADTAYLRSPFFAEELPAGDYAFIEVEDNGCGMSGETVARIFDPFFTTKFTGRGLGLAAVLGIVRSHRGVIKVTSTPGRGSLFEVLFPSAAPKVEPAALGQKSLPRGQGTVLVVEDEPSVRDFAQRVLESAGFQVRSAADGREALELFVRHGPELVAVLLDLTMPRMDGLEVLRHLRGLSAKVPILVMSGYREVDVAPRLAGLGATRVIQKPFQPRDLIAQVCQFLPAKGVAGDP
jgi:two-component system cell cycle sensor histidine kinase/response regulator CckA